MSATPHLCPLSLLEPKAQAEAAALYWDAFSGKLGRLLGAQGPAFVARMLDPTHALAALNPAGELIGVAGFRSPEGSFVSFSPEALAAHYGRWGGMWRSGALKLLGEDVDNTRFLIDGLAVAASARGQGTGRALLAGLADLARGRGYATLRLDVANTNPRARALYLRCGFTVVARQSLPLARPLFGLTSCEVMECRL